jgi:uncharacterized delta-60 repeat protein
MSADSAFYTYAWDSAPGSLSVDGDLAGEGLGRPFFVEFSETGSGHPSGYTFGWVRNDDDTLYVALDFVPDNTMDGEKDYATVYVRSPQTLKVLKTFRVSMPEQSWGRPGFVYTPRAVYQHKVYEFAIPLHELDLDDISPGTPFDQAHGKALELAFAAYGTAAPPAPLYPGWLDATFAGDGILTTTVGSDSFGEAVALQPDGKIVVAGESDNNFALVRYTVSGTLDSNFGSGGVITTDFGNGSSDTIYAVAIQDDGKIVVAGENSGWYLALARYNWDGSPDDSFGRVGYRVNTDIGPSDDTAQGLALEPDGDIVAVGYSRSGGRWRFALARYGLHNCWATIDGSTVYSSVNALAVQQAVDAASPGDTVKVAGDCAGVQERGGLMQVVYVSRSLTLQGGYTTTNWSTPDPDVYPTTLDAQGRGRVALVIETAATLEYLHLTGGDATATDDGNGGGIAAYASVLTVSHSTLVSNSAQFGGGLVNNAAQVILQATVISDNVAQDSGAGIANTGEMVLTAVTLTHNVAAADGGGIINYGVLTLSNSYVVSNTAAYGGGIYNHGATLTLNDDNQVWDNRATENGGGIYNDSRGSAALVTLNDNTQVVGNVADVNGGGIFNDEGELILNASSQVIGNTAQNNEGGGIFNDGWGSGNARTTLNDNSAVNANQALEKGGGISNLGGTVTLTGNSQVSGNTAGVKGGGINNEDDNDQGVTLVLYDNSQIVGNTARYGGGLYNDDDGGGATITLNDDSQVWNNRAIINGGGIYNDNLGGVAPVSLNHNTRVVSNTADNDGGGIFNDEGALSLNASSQVISNTAQDDGGGIYNDGQDLGNATITLNTNSAVNANQAADNGGGIHNREGTVALTGASQVSSNTAAFQDGGINNDDNGGWGATLTMQGNSQVAGNTAAYGGGIFNDDDGGGATLTLNDDSQVWNNRATLEGGGIFNNARGGAALVHLNHNAQVVSNTAEYGGGIANVESALTLNDNSRVISNTANFGGGIYNWGGFVPATVILDGNSQVRGNQATADGGGAFVYSSTLILAGGAILSNSAGSDGGGVYVDATTAVFSQTGGTVGYNTAHDTGGGIYVNAGQGVWRRGSVISNTAAYNGGGIYIKDGSHSVEGSAFSGNQALSCKGGGIYNRATLTVDGSTFAANSAGSDCYGGGGTFNSGMLTVTNSTFSGNRSGKYDGGIGNEGSLSTLTIINSTFSDNESSGGGGVDIFGGILRLQNTIIANSVADSDCANSSGTIATDVNNLIEDGSCNPALSGDPLLGPLADNGGPLTGSGQTLQTMALLPGSPALDQIPAGVDGCGTSITSDQRGVVRPQGDNCDIGAYEAEYFTLTVSLAGSGSGSVSGSGINCGEDCSAGYPDSTVVTLTASADNGSTFSRWSGDLTGTVSPAAITMTRDMSLCVGAAISRARPARLASP